MYLCQWIIIIYIIHQFKCENFISSSDPNIWYVGRTKILQDGSRLFDWSATSIFINIKFATYLDLII